MNEMDELYDLIVTGICPAAFSCNGLKPLTFIKDIKCIGVDTIIMASDRAAEFLDKTRPPAYDRGFDQKHSDFLYREMLAGRFVPAQAVLTLVKLGDDIYRLDLKHTLRAITRLKEGVYLPIALALYQAKSEEAMRSLYMSLDSNKPRTADDKAYAALQADPAFADSRKQDLLLLVRGFRFYFFNQRGGKIDTWEVLSDLKSENYLALTQEVFQLLHAAPQNCKGIVKKAAVVGAMFQTIAINRKKGISFWKQVLGISNYTGSTNGPQTQLVAKLSSLNVSLGKSDRVYPFLLSMNAFNAFMEKSQRDISPLATQIDAGRPERVEPSFT